MKTGIELIAQERKEQIEKHGFTFEKYDRYYTHGELLQAACFCLNLANPQYYFLEERDQHIIPRWPKKWDVNFKNKIVRKSKIGQLIVAGAFFMAEGDRIGHSDLYNPYIKKIAAEIDRLQSSEL
jgi:hypothetical protein